MSTNKILLKFAKKGINLSPEAYNKVINAENPVDFASSLIVKLKGDNFSSKDLVSVSGKTIDEIMGIKTKEEPKEIPFIKTDEKKAESPDEKKQGEEKPEIQTPPKNETASIDSLKKETDEKEKHINETILEASQTVKDEKIQFKRNLEKSNVEYDFKIIQDTSKKSYTSGELENLISYFQSRYEKLYNVTNH